MWYQQASVDLCIFNISYATKNYANRGLQYVDLTRRHRARKACFCEHRSTLNLQYDMAQYEDVDQVEL